MLLTKTIKTYLFSEDIEDGVLSDYILAKIIEDIRDFTDNTCGAMYVILYSVPQAVKFYQRNGFKCFEEYMVKNNERFLDGCVPMFLKL